MRSSSWLGKQ
uniref:Uncharacterized protein n=1 Tax=Arundo donax TaxID=35708 RepID=A0A0A9AN21_ARUDO